MDFWQTPVILPGKASQIRKAAPRVERSPERNRLQGLDYAEKFVKEEEEIYKMQQPQLEADAGVRIERGKSTSSIKTESGSVHCPLSDIESVTTGVSGLEFETDDKLGVYEKYKFNNKPSQKLSIEKYKTQILQAIDSQKIVIITGATGCGKTTQVPQYILDSAYSKKVYCNIVVTQPRRLAAVTVCKRVVENRKEILGKLIGYQIGQDKKGDADTRILFCTTGVLLQKLIANNKESEFTHYILDEVHERDQEMDFLLIIIRKLLNTKFFNAKLIIMSATINVDPFVEYLYSVYAGKKVFPRLIKVEEKHNFEITTYYLDDIAFKIIEAQTLGVPEKPEISPKAYIVARRLIQAFSIIDQNEKERKGAVLIFLPGLYEIEEMHKTLKDTGMTATNEKDESNWEIYPLHSSITYEEQQRVFKVLDPSKRKIILSTNIAESSLTVPDVKYVIDFCLTKTLVKDPETNFTSLLLDWASKSSLDQRAGRVGRVAIGRVYRLIYKNFYKESLDQDTKPEILRCPLDRLVLQAKMLKMGSPAGVLALAMNQPDLGNIQQAVASLKEIGALTLKTTVEGGGTKYDECDGDITHMGEVIISLPMDVRLGKLIFIGGLFNVLDEAIIMACAMSTKNMFSMPFREDLKSYNSKLMWSDSSCSDCIAYSNAYKGWRECATNGTFNTRSEKLWAREEFIQLKVLSEIAILEKEVNQRIRKFNLKGAPNSGTNVFDNKIEKSLFLKLAIAGAFYPNYFFRIPNNSGGEETAVNTCGGNDPFSTVYLRGMPANHPPIFYKSAIRSYFEDISHQVNVTFDSGSKVYVNFGRKSSKHVKGKDGRSLIIPGRIEMAVYRALKLRQCQPKGALKIRVLNPLDAKQRYEMYMKQNKKYQHTESITELEKIAWPWNRNAKTLTDILTVQVSHAESPSQFWVSDTRRESINILEKITGIINAKENLNQLKKNDDVHLGKMYALGYEENDQFAFYRCRILSKNKTEARHYVYVAQFIDFGNTMDNVVVDQIYEIKPIVRKINPELDFPDFAVECYMAKVKPAGIEELWSKKALEIMGSILYKRTKVKVYSFSNEVLSLYVMHPNRAEEPFNKKITINYILVQSQCAVKENESYLSLVDHDERKRIKRKMEENEEEISDLNPSRALKINRSFEDIEPPSPNDCRQEVYLKGPYSPLEMKVSSMSKVSMAKNVIIEKDSVNSVLLDSDPSSTHERMLVAAFVGTNPTKDKLQLRHTTILPSNAGLPAYTCMLFAPMVELRCDPHYTRFTGAICGLGYDESTGKSFYPENDLEIIFDVDIMLDDITLINKIRREINEAVYGNQSKLGSVTHSHDELLEKIKILLYRDPIPQPIYYQPNTYRWGLLPYDKLLSPCDYLDVTRGDHPSNDFSMVYRFIWGVVIETDLLPDRNDVDKNLQEIRTLASGQLVRRGGVECTLCGVILEKHLNARLHLKNAQHKLRLSQYEKQNDIDSETKTEFAAEESEHGSFGFDVENF